MVGYGIVFIVLASLLGCQGKTVVATKTSSSSATCDMSDSSCVTTSVSSATADESFVVNSPTTGLANTPVETSWAAVDGAKEYVVILSTNADCTDVVQSYSGIEDTSYKLETENTGSFYLCALAVTDLGLVKSGSSSQKIEIQSETTTLTTPTSPTSTSSFATTDVTFNWSAVTSAATYFIEIGTSSGASDIYSGNVGNVLTYTTSATDGQSYYARIKAIDTDGNSSEFSADSTVIVSDQQAPTAASTLKIVADSSSGTHASLDNDTSVYAVWTASTDASSGMASTTPYSISWYDQASCAGTETAVTSTTTFKEITGLTAGTTYSFKVTSYDAVGNSVTSSCSSSIQIDMVAPVALQASSGSAGSTGSNIDLSIDFPADTSDYSQVLIYRSAGSTTTGVAAPACGSGTLASTITDFSTDPLTVNDSTGSFGKYFSYRICISDTAGNVTSSDTIIDEQSRSLTALRQYAAGMLNGSANTGDIGTNTTSTWTDLTANTNGTLNNFALPSDADSGWDGDGTGSDPYRLKFDGTNDSLSIGTPLIKAVTMWFKADTIDTTNRYLLYEMQGCCNTPISIFLANNSLSISSRRSEYLTHGVEVDQWHQVAFTYDGSSFHAYLNGVYMGSLTADDPAGWNSAVYIGSVSGSSAFFDGSIADVRVYSEHISGTDIHALYAETASSYRTNGSMVVAAVDPAIGPTSGSTEVIITGENLGSVNSITFGGVAGTSVTVLSDYAVKVTTPANTSTGYEDVVVSDGSNTETISDGFRYTLTPLDNLFALLDASNTDRGGLVGDTSNPKEYWNSINSGIGIGMKNSASPSNTNSGWNGSGSTASPYQLKFDGTNDHAYMDLPFKSLSIWFNADIINSTTRYLFHQLGTCCVTANAASLKDGAIQFSTFNSSYLYSSVEANQWNHLAISNDGSNTSGYLNGHLIGVVSGAAPMRTSYFYLGSSDTPNSYYDGSVMEFRAYTDAITASEVQSMYSEGLAKVTVTSTFSVSSIASATGALAGGNTVSIYGANLTGVDAITFGGTAATSFTVVSDHFATAVVPASGSASVVDVVVSKGADDVTVTNGYRYTETMLSNVQAFLDATNIDRNGTPGGDGTSSTNWNSTGSGFGYQLNGFAQPGDGSSGWDGDGSTGDPYRLNFDGSDDYISGYVKFKAISVWFNADTVDATNRHLFYQMDTCCTASNTAYVANGNLYTSTRSSTLISTAITSGGWHHLVITNDGSNTRAYLDNTLIGTETGNTSPEVSSTALFYIGDNAASSGAFDGSISEFRTYTDNLNSTEVGKLYNETKGRFGL